MLMLAQDTLPLSNTSARTPGPESRGTSSAPAWQAEMQRAQSALVLTRSGGSVADVSARPPLEHVPLASASSLPARQRFGDLRVSCEGPLRETPTHAEAPNRDMPPQKCGARVEGKDADDVLASKPVRRTAARALHAPDPQVRVHVEREGAGVAVWIGVPARFESAAARALAVLSELHRHAQSSGGPVRRLVCNGTTLYAIKATKENP